METPNVKKLIDAIPSFSVKLKPKYGFFNGVYDEGEYKDKYVGIVVDAEARGDTPLKEVFTKVPSYVLVRFVSSEIEEIREFKNFVQKLYGDTTANL